LEEHLLTNPGPYGALGNGNEVQELLITNIDNIDAHEEVTDHCTDCALNTANVEDYGPSQPRSWMDWMMIHPKIRRIMKVHLQLQIKFIRRSNLQKLIVVCGNLMLLQIRK